MFRLSRTTDYGIVLLSHLARTARAGGDASRNARELAEEVELPAPMVSKILKALARAGLLESQRGAKGGYRLTRRPELLSVAEMVGALEGPVSLTDCSTDDGLCEHMGRCAVRDPWRVINRAVHETLSEMSLADLIDPHFPVVSQPLEILGRPELARGGDAPFAQPSVPGPASAFPGPQSPRSQES